ncbi:FAD/NAD(P)-binding oxidoreductase, partial [Pseudomonas aeruginosa]|nr:FAD/NAD(P)-binding oxidoreductase [Pseudomonas aeruginosa]
ACGPGRRLLLEDPQRGWQVGYRRLVLCTGARELLLPFPGWTLPGVTGAGGLQALAKGGLPQLAGPAREAYGEGGQGSRRRLFARSYRADSYVLAALGEERLEAVRLREGGRVREIACERLACGFGLVPNVQLGQA